MSFRWPFQGKPPGGGNASARRYRPSPDVMSALHGDKIVLLDMRSEQYYTLDDVGAKIWTLMPDAPSAAQIAAGLAQVYEAPAEQIRQDVDAFLQGLLRDRLVEETAQ